LSGQLDAFNAAFNETQQPQTEQRLPFIRCSQVWHFSILRLTSSFSAVILPSAIAYDSTLAVVMANSDICFRIPGSLLGFPQHGIKNFQRGGSYE